MNNYEENISICFCINNNYSKHLGVVLTSILYNNKNSKFKFYVLTSDLTDENKNILESLKTKYKNFEINYINVDKSIFKDFKLNIDYISIETYYRYLLAKIIPNENKILYVDVDLIVNGELNVLWNIDISKFYCAAVKEINIDIEKYKETIDIKKDNEYINAGVILFNLKKIREHNITEQFFINNEKYKDKILYQDQCVINITLQDKIKIIDNIYNFTTKLYKKDKNKIKNAKIIHFVGAKKPWKKVSFNPLKRLYYFYYLRSPYAKIRSFNDFIFCTLGLLK